MPRLNIENFRGGLSLLEPSNIEDNQFEVLTNMFYNKDKRVQSRRGYTTFGEPVPDSVVLINACDATTNFAVSDDAVGLATSTAIRGTFSVKFDIDVSNSASDFAILSNSSLGTIDITSDKGYLGFFLFVPTGFNTNLTSVKVQLGSDSSNFFEFTLGTLTENTNNFIKLNYTDATTTGTPVETSIDFFQLRVDYTSGYLDQTGVLIDSIFSYSVNSTKAVTSYFFFQNDTTADTTALCTAGTNMFKFDETSDSWEVIATALSEFEADGTTKSRWSFAVYLNIVYMANGLDAYSSFNGTLFKAIGGQPKVRYLRFMADSIYGAGEDLNPSTAYATTAGAADAETLNANSLVVGGDELGRINGILDLGNVFIVWKSKKIYSVAGDLTSSQAIDSQNGGYSHRALKNVENGILYYNDTGVDRLRPRNAIAGASAMATEPLTADLRDLVDQIDPKQYNANIGNYILPLTNYYFTFDTTNDGIPDTTLVYSSLTGAWSRYQFPAIFDYGFYINTDEEIQYLAASANGGQMYQIETGFSDNGIEIPTELVTKEWDFGDVAQWKTYDTVDLIGFKNLGSEVSIEIIVEGEIAAGATLDDTFIDGSSPSIAIGTNPIGSAVIGGGGTDAEIDLFPYLIRIPIAFSGPNIKIRMFSNSTPNVWTLDKARINYLLESLDIFPTVNIG